MYIIVQAKKCPTKKLELLFFLLYTTNMNWFQHLNYKRFISKLKNKITNKDISIISNNCIGGVLYHDLGIRFNSPTINTLIYGNEFVYFANNLKYYISINLVLHDNTNYPIGILKSDNPNLPDIYIHFLHDNDFEIAKQNWNRRKQRVNYNNLIIIYEHFNKTSTSVLQDYNSINCDKKIAFTHKKFKNIPCSFYVKACKNEKSFGTITKFKNKFSGKRNLYCFDMVNFLKI